MAEVASDDPGQTVSRQLRSLFNGSALAVIAGIQERLRPVCSGDLAAQQEAWWLLESATGRSRTRLVADGACVLDDTARRFVEYALAERVEKQKPIEYVLGAVAFCGFAFEVAEPVLIPRQETEEWLMALVKTMKEKIPSNVKFSILDACTGSGCIGLVLAAAFPNATVIGIDVSADAIALADRNKQRFGINNITFIKCSVEEFIENTNKSFDLIVSNPPYLSRDEFSSACVECPSLRWESSLALIGGDDGLYFYRHILSRASKV
ncbi:peptide chain release factor N(5)-glutamine methyltransferase, partial [Candidatus Dependentiae bacterium]|nr:peptide chain release factor N(5)-glutamine methyltransferase [Candidatus Dependentiae bacterium]